MTSADDIIMAHRQVESVQLESKREILADVQHEIWSSWMEYLFQQCILVSEGMAIPFDKVSRWVRQMNTSYSELSEGEKDSDRDQADKVLEVLK